MPLRRKSLRFFGFQPSGLQSLIPRYVSCYGNYNGWITRLTSTRRFSRFNDVCRRARRTIVAQNRFSLRAANGRLAIFSLGFREEFVEQVLAAAALPIIRMPAGRAYVMDEIHRLLSPYLRIGTPVL